MRGEADLRIEPLCRFYVAGSRCLCRLRCSDERVMGHCRAANPDAIGPQKAWLSSFGRSNGQVNLVAVSVRKVYEVVFRLVSRLLDEIDRLPLHLAAM
jgi:hypothetical protein